MMDRDHATTETRWVLTAIVALAAFLRLWELGSKSLGVDESFSVLLAREPLSKVITGDLHPPLYHILLHYVTRFSANELAVRFPSAFAGIVTVPLTYLYLNTLGLRNAGLWAAGLLAISPVHIHHSQEARMYTILALFCILSQYTLARMWQTGKMRYAVGHGFSTALALYTHALAWTVVAANWVIMLALERTRLFRRNDFLWSQAGAILLYAPWFLQLARHVASVHASASEQSVLRSVAALFITATNFTCGYHYYLNDSGMEVFCLVLIILSVWVWFRALVPLYPDNATNVFLTAGVWVPLAMVCAMAGKANLTQTKYFFTALLPALAITGCGLERLRLLRSPTLPVYLVGTLAMAGIAEWRYFGPQQLGRDPWRDVTRHIQDRFQTGDIVILDGPWSYFAFKYYSRDTIPFRGMPRRVPVTPQSVDRELRDLPWNAYRRIFLILSPGSHYVDDPHDLVYKWLKQHMCSARRMHFKRIVLYVFHSRQWQDKNIP